MFKKTSMEHHGISPKFDHNFKLLGKYGRLFEEIDVYPLLKLRKGWNEIVDHLAMSIDSYTKEKKFPGFRFLSMTERNGELFIDHVGSDPTIETMIDQAISLSKRTCVECGMLGNGSDFGIPFCEKHTLIAKVGGN